jgi:hypothetical protein
MATALRECAWSRGRNWFFVSIAVAGLCLALPGRGEAANGGVAVDDTDVDPVGACKVDSWAQFASNRDRNAVVSPGCVFDFGRPVDVTFGFQRQRSDGEWSTAGSVKLRTLIVEGGVGKVSLLFSAGATYDFTADEVSQVLVNIPATFQALENLKLNVNAGWLYDRPNEVHWATWGASFDWSVNDRFSLIGEVFGQFGHNIVDSPHLNDPRAQLAFRFKPNENLDFDVIYGRNIMGENAHWITVGLNVRFNAFGERSAAAQPAALRRPTFTK